MRLARVIGCLVVLLPQMAAALAPEPRFIRLAVEDGLSQQTVISILQDRAGFLWFGTQDGLNRFDGYEMRVFLPDDSDPQSISDNYIRAIVEDPDGLLWVGTQSGGLNRYDRFKEAFTSFRYDPDDPDSLPSDSVRSLTIAPNRDLWIGTGSGLAIYEHASGRIRRVDLPIGPIPILDLLFDDSGDLWVATDGAGLIQLYPNGQIGRHLSTSVGPQNWPSDIVNVLPD